ncbi:hypothetical protein EON65_10700 [archaeon]|nr:MAG: hypothetical protein EON65_10700 [archaeon]
MDGVLCTCNKDLKKGEAGAEGFLASDSAGFGAGEGGVAILVDILALPLMGLAGVSVDSSGKSVF